ncbi:MAG: RsmE family RNA methyltransferase [Litorilinea sp.]
MHRFLLPGVQPDAGGVLDLSPLAHQLGRVLRASPGVEVLVLDNTGRAYHTRLTALAARSAQGQVIASHMLPEPRTRLTLYLCALKADKFEWVLQKGTELGISTFVPVLSARTVVRPLAALEKKRARWETILREATEQCGRGIMPHLAAAVTWSDAVGASTAESVPPLLKLVAWEALAPDLPHARVPDVSHPSTPSFSASSPAPQALGQVVANWLDTAEPAHRPHIACAIGPEGGLEADEVAVAEGAGWQVVGLGPRILRAETAALAAATIILQICGEFAP